ncbi:MAG: rhomboid family intramembrane serine protease [Paludibacter sp.]|nr:rhomboid family intramembrane serine protease [Paludibacter sp.]
MNKQTEKLRLIYLPFLIITISIIGGYSFLNWLIIIKLQLFPIKDFIVNFIVPFILPWIPILIWLRPRIKLLSLKTKNGGDLPFLYQLIAAFAIAIPTIIAQKYLETATGKLTELPNISQIDKYEATKFYKLKDYYIDKEHTSVSKKVEVSGKHNEDLNLRIYIVCPILKSKKATEILLFKEYDNASPLIVIDGKPLPGIRLPNIPKENIDSLTVLKGDAAIQLYGERARNGVTIVFTKRYDGNRKSYTENTFDSDTVKAWLGVLYKDRISNRLSVEDKERLYESFIKHSQSEFEYTDLSKFIYLKRQGYSDDLDEYKKAIGRSPLVYASNTVLISVNESFESRNGNKLAWIFGSFGIGCLIWLLMVLIPKLEKIETKELKTGKYRKKKSELLEFFSFFIPKEGFFVSCIILDLNILVFLVMVFAGLGFISFQGSDLLEWGANFKPLTTDGEWWRLLTSTFLHGGIMHLAANMYGLLFVGIFLEPRIGKTKFAVIYIVTGILASFASLWWHDATVSVGASGAIFGLYGLFLALMLTKVYPKEFSKALLVSTLVFIGFNLLYGLTGGIDNAAHIGGLVSGFVIGLFISPQLKEEAEEVITVKGINNNH